MKLSNFETPFLVLEHDKLRANVARMQDKILQLGGRLRPHVKTAKCQEVVAYATREEANAGITVSTLKEADYFLAHGFTDILYAVGITPNKLEHVANLLQRGADITVVLDNPSMAQVIAATPRADTCVFPVLIEIDSDGHRSGVQPDDPILLEIAHIIDASDVMSLRGVMTHAGSSYHCDKPEQIAKVAAQEHRAITHSANRIRSAGLPCPVISLGSTPTALFAETLAGVTEVRAGVYMFFDLVMAGLGVCKVEDIAVSLACSVIGHQPQKQQLITDGGWMALSRDRGTASQKLDQGYGLVCDQHGQVLEEDLIVVSANQEHGIIQRRNGGELDLADFPIGSMLRILPNHACATCAQHDRYHVINESSKVEAIWSRFNGW